MITDSRSATAEARALLEHPIPPITDKLGQYWDQPDRQNILVDAKCAVMSQATFDKLRNYTASRPTGTYVGKMWRALYVEKGKWFLCWFGFDDQEPPRPDYVTINYREILISS